MGDILDASMDPWVKGTNPTRTYIHPQHLYLVLYSAVFVYSSYSFLVYLFFVRFMQRTLFHSVIPSIVSSRYQGLLYSTAIVILTYTTCPLQSRFQPTNFSLLLFSCLLFCSLLFSFHASLIPTLITNPLLVPSVWMVIARCDGGSGQLLGQAASSSLDGVRAWICAVILLSSRYRCLSLSLSFMIVLCIVHTNICRCILRVCLWCTIVCITNYGIH